MRKRSTNAAKTSDSESQVKQAPGDGKMARVKFTFRTKSKNAAKTSDSDTSDSESGVKQETGKEAFVTKLQKEMKYCRSYAELKNLCKKNV